MAAFDRILSGISDIVEANDILTDIVKICDVSGADVHFYNDLSNKKAICIFNNKDKL